MKRYSAKTAKYLNKAKLIEVYLEVQKAHDVQKGKVNLIQNALPDTSKKLWWLKIIQIIKLIIDILNLDDEAVLDKSYKSKKLDRLREG